MMNVDVEDLEPVTSSARPLMAAAIPPFSFTGKMRVQQSGFWTPHYNIRLEKGYVTSRGGGSGPGGWYFAVLRGASEDAELLGLVGLDPEETKRNFYFDNSTVSTVVTPYDMVYVGSLAASRHENVLIQFLGWRV